MRKLLNFAILFITLILYNSMAQEINKPFVLQHLFHKHKIDFTNAVVIQQLDNYSSIYNTSHILARLNLTTKDFIFLNISKTFGDGLTKKLEREGFSISTTGDDLETYLKNINDTGRKYLLELFYQREEGNITITIGLIDTTAFIDANEYANDEHTQFLNPVFINNPIALLPSYNLGIAIHYVLNDILKTTLVYTEDKEHNGNVGILELEIEKKHLKIRPYYFYLFNNEEYKGFGVSGDYKINQKFGIFSRIGNSTSDYKYFASIGSQIEKLFFDDRIGIAYGYIKGKSLVKDINIAEIYYLINIVKNFSITFDVQYLKEEKTKYIYGIRTYFFF